MSLKNMDQLNAMHFDVLREIGNIGQGNAASSLSQMLSQTIDISVPTVKLLDFNESVEYLGGPENVVLGMLVGLKGDINGMMLYVLQKSFANSMLKAVFGKEINDLTELDEMDLSFIREIGNILAGSYVNAISSLTGLTIDISVPTISIDMAGAILAVPAVEFAQIGNSVLFIDDSFIFGGSSSDNSEVKSNMILVPELSSLETLFSRLGIEV
ncbi:MAG: chemotaxis protein CheC [Oscillospiraceae bacterium]|nr:chemotaxis protein CheC [Oscillospiraceae bacterium]MCI7498961.1 chemotaxis protein CheC [Oscillospiraceae bacterium]MDD7278392.1 chemotaxis protein CheC [Oscillospiraceae bacterium]MDY2862602.1 chemotaxis protein CheC [Oscillospiraceae bacterium]